MSDPVSSMDVEDVLSSIRRLVSEESKASSPARDTSKAAKDIAKDPQDLDTQDHFNALIGSSSANTGNSEGDTGQPPSNEVVAGAKPEDDRAADDKLGDIVRQFTRVDAQTSTTDEQKLVLTAALRVSDDETSEPQEPSIRPIRTLRPERLHLRAVEDTADGQTPPVAAKDTTLTAGVPPRGFKFEAAPDDLLFDRAARAMDAYQNNRTPEAPAARKAPATPEATAEVVQEPAAQADPAKADDEPQNTATGPQDDTQIGRSDASPFHRGAGAFAQGPDVAMADEERQPSPSPKSAFERAEADNIAREDVGETQISYDAADSDDEASTINFAEMDESVLDEDTLRELVSQMVREELQGELGDRITRNVRKLVRREIQRALASREFE